VWFISNPKKSHKKHSIIKEKNHNFRQLLLSLIKNKRLSILFWTNQNTIYSHNSDFLGAHPLQFITNLLTHKLRYSYLWLLKLLPYNNWRNACQAAGTTKPWKLTSNFLLFLPTGLIQSYKKPQRYSLSGDWDRAFWTQNALYFQQHSFCTLRVQRWLWITS